MDRQALEQARTQLKGLVQYGQPPEYAGLWAWKAGTYTSKAGMPSKAVAEEDFRVFLKSDLPKFAQMKSAGNKATVNAFAVRVPRKPRGNAFPAEILEFANQYDGSARQKAVAACQHARTVQIIGSINPKLIRLVEEEIRYQQKTA